MKNSLVNTFINLVKIGSESRNEGVFHSHLLDLLSDLGLEIYEDDSKSTTGLGGNNIIATLKGNEKKESLFLSCHTDTVSPGTNIVPSIKDGVIVSSSDTILGADDKAGIAVMIELIKTLKDSEIDHPTLEFVLTPGEEIGLAGAMALDISKIESKRGLVLDSDGCVGGITLGSPTLVVIDIEIYGKSAHAGLQPEAGISAIKVAADIISNLPQGRINAETTANFGVICGGVGTNVLADKTTIKAEIRSLDDDQLHGLLNRYYEVSHSIGNHYGAKVTMNHEIKCHGYTFDRDDTFINSISQSIENVGLKTRYDFSGGGSDANVFNSKGKQAVNISVGYENIHTTDESISIESIERLYDVCLNVVRGEYHEES